MFRDLIPLLADRYHLVAPDLPGFGNTVSPPRGPFDYTFDNLARVIGGFVEAIGLSRYALYEFDYGAPVGFRLAVAHPERVAAVVSLNGNAYLAGFSDASRTWQYFRMHQPPLLAIWGKNDSHFLPPGAEAYRRDIPDADVRFLDTGHFALETHSAEIGRRCGTSSTGSSLANGGRISAHRAHRPRGASWCRLGTEAATPTLCQISSGATGSAGSSRQPDQPSAVKAARQARNSSAHSGHTSRCSAARRSGSGTGWRAATSSA